MPVDKLKNCARCGGECYVARVYQTDNEWIAYCKACGVIVRKYTRRAVAKAALKPSHSSRYTPCPRFRCDWKCRIGYNCKCGGIACRIERHSV